MKFGDALHYKGKDYIFLATTDEITYLAYIPGIELSKQLVERRERVFTRGARGSKSKQDNIAWCFIVLRTYAFKDRIAHYGQSGMDYHPDYFLDVIGKLDTNDQKELQKEILDDNAVSGDLKELVKELVIK